MKKLDLLLAIAVGFCFACQSGKGPDKEVVAAAMQPSEPGPITLVVHGGAGNITKENMTSEMETAYHEKLKEALNAGYAILENGGGSLEAVSAAIVIMEESPLFNAGVGAVFTNEGKNELDASIMDGASGLAGAVAGVSTIKSPILAARAVMENSEHVMMAGKGAEKFAREQGLEMVDPDYFFDERRFQQLKRIKDREMGNQGMLPYNPSRQDKFGTVGAVALDQQGNLAAGTSTGGMTNKKFGRIGDSPIIGAGTYADNATCAVSCTGHGEYFIRSLVAYDIAALMKYRDMSLQQASNEVVMNKLQKKGGSGGVITLDRQGNISMVLNTSGMYRGFIKEKGSPRTFIYRE